MNIKVILFQSHLLLVLLFVDGISSDAHLECASWSSMERLLIHEAQQVNCTINSNCSGITCSIYENGYHITGGVSINLCESSPSIYLSIDVPKLNIKKWQKQFHHGDNFSLSESLGGSIEMVRKDNKFTLGLVLDIPFGLKPDSLLLHLIPSLASSSKYQVFQNVTVFVPSCPPIQNGRKKQVTVPPLLPAGAAEPLGNCSILNSSCAVNEICRQLNKSKSDGICVCITDYVRNAKGKCVHESPETSTETPSSDPQPSKKTSNTSLLLTAILVPITVIVVAVVLVYATIKFRVFQHLRRRLRVQVYEHVLLGQDEDEDESLNPVA